MAEFNPYKLEEEKWTPKNVYEILPPNAVSWSDYDFGQGTDNVDGEAASKSFIDGFVDFFSDLFGTAGQILGGALELGGKVLSGFVNGVANLIGGIAKAVGSIFGGPSESPYPPMFSPIKVNLEAAIQPFKDQIQDSKQKSEDLLAEQLVIREQIAEQVEITRAAVEDAKAASERSGAAIERAEAAREAATEARETLEEYNTALTEQIRVEFNAAVGRADTAVEKADTLAGELADFQARHQLEIDEAIGKAEQASQDLAALSPQVESALAESSAASQRVADLTPQVSEAVDKAEAAVGKADQTLSEYTAWAKAQKTRIDSAVSKAEKASSDLAALSPQVEDAVAQSAAATENVATLTPQVSEAVSKAGAAVTKADQTLSEYTAWAKAQKTRIDSAVSKAEKASSDLATLTPKITDAVDKASKASSDVSALTTKVTAAQTRADNAYTEAGKVRSEVTPKIEAAQTKGENALAVADKAVDWLRNPNEIGASLIAIDPETKKPNWAEHLVPVEAEENPLGLPNAYKTGDYYYRNPRRMPVNVDPSTEYMVSLWVKADKPGSQMTYDIRNQDGELAFDDRRKVDGFLDAGDKWRAYWIKSVPTEWTQYKKIVTPRETTRTAEFGISYFKHSSGDTQDVVQYIADFQIYPLVPSQLDVDQAQNDAIRANAEILRQQEEINEAQRVFNDFHTQFSKDQVEWNSAVDRSLATQDTVNKNFDKWTEAATKAVEANTTAIKALTKPEIGSSLIALDADTREPHYLQWAGSPRTPSTAGLPFTKAVRVDSSEQVRKDAPSGMRVPVKVNPDIVYKWSVWLYANKPGTEIAFLTTSDSIGLCVEKTTYKQDGKDDRVYTSKWGIFPKDIPTGWSKHEGTIKFMPGTDNVHLYAVEWNKTNVASASQWFGAFDIVPDVPTQAQVDDAQNKAIESLNILAAKQEDWNDGTTAALDAQKKVDDNFKIWSDGAATAINANTTAIKALSKIDTGESLIAYLEPTDAEVKAGTAKYDVPVWTTGAHREFNGNNPPPENVKYAFGAASNQGTIAARKVPVTVRPGTKYILSFWAYGSGDLVVYMLGNGAGHPVRSTRQLMVDQDTLEVLKDAGGRRRYDPANNGNSSNANGTQWLLNGFKPDQLYKWVHYKFEVEFTESTTEVWFQNFYWNWKTASVYGQYLAGMQFYPDVPTQADVDEAQNKAIEALNLFQEKQEEWSAGVEAALETQDFVNKNFKEWSDGAKTAIEANTRALAIINSGKQGSNIIPVNPDSGRPWFAEPLKESTDHPPLTSGPTYYSPAAQTSVTTYGPYVEVDPKIRYTLSFWAKASKAGSVMYGQFRSQEGRNVTPTGEPLAKGGVTVANPPQPSNKDSSGNYVHDASKNSYFVSNLKLNTTWTYYETEIQFNEGVTAVSIMRMYWSHSNGVKADQYISGLSVRPQIPTQASVDKAQNDAISANTEALKALGKKVLGASLVPYKTPSTKEVEDYTAGKLDYDPWAEPEYYDAGWTVDLSPGEGKRTPKAVAGNGNKGFRGTYVSVDSSIAYRVKFRTYAGAARSGMSIAILDQDGNHATAKTPFTSVGSGSGYLLYRYPLAKGWQNHEGVITFKPGVKEVRLATFYWNSTSGTGMDTTTTQRFLDLEIVPDIPDANVVNMLQDQAILENTQVGKENKKAIDALTEGLDAYAAAADLERLHKDIGEELEKEQDARAELAAEINNYMVESIPRTIIYGSGPQFNDHISAERYKIIAKPGWVGQMLLDVTYVSKSDGSQTKRVITNYNVPDTDGSREYDVPNASFGGYQPAYRLDYWIYRGKSIQKALSNSGSYITGSSFTKNSWTRIATHTIKKSNGAVHILWRTRLTRADRGVTYSFDVRVNGTSVLTKNYKGYGPLTSLGSGVANLSFSGNLSVPDNGKIEVYAKASGTTNQASVSSNKGTLTYLELE